MEDINYDYGFLGVFMTYFLMPFALMLALMMGFLAYAVAIYPGNTGFFSGVMLPIFLVFSAFLCIGGAVVSPKYAYSYSRNYRISNRELQVLRRETVEAVVPLDDAEIYYRLLTRVIEINHPALRNGVLLLMNNHRFESSMFYDLKRYFLDNHNTKVRWFGRI